MPGRKRTWGAWDLQLLSVGAANGVPYQRMAKVFGVTACAAIGVYWRARNPSPASKRPALGRPVHARTIYVKVDDEQFAEIEALRGRHLSRAAVIRDLIEWGLEAHRENQ